MSKTLVTCYKSPDLDGTACTIAYSELLNKTNRNKTAAAAIFGNPTVEAQFVLDYLKLPIPRQSGDEYDQITLTDSSTPIGLAAGLQAEKVTEIIDHRKDAELEFFPNLKNSTIERVGAAATLIVEKFQDKKIDISKESAILLHQAIVSNTLNFQANVTTSRDVAAAEYLRSIANIPANLTTDMFEAKSDMAGDNLRKNIENDMTWKTIGDKSYLVGQLELIGAKSLVLERKLDILSILQETKEEKNLDGSFISIIDLEAGNNTFVCEEKDTQDLLTNALNIRFIGNVALRPGLIMRKEIIPLLQSQ